ncbi:RanGTP-binding protein-domain-containing protein [Tricharina praecox]|uniref:RanGTP-binding protein-domain-containing protein n=1 Tax=Tricharina praecox TaxID=43433 RepID=UPI00221EBF5F|nr:RanGTP-binding protein-domain-containing protein [Tricharina praecox]KAI5849891.1 RanGTP-binding protein-domain-containing protein [Tricharina praecox]
MEIFLNKVSQQAVSFAIRSGIIVTSQFAIRQCGRYISSIKGKDRKELQRLQERLETKIKIVSPAIDLVEILSARGNTSLESALTLTKDIRHGIEKLGKRMEALSDQNAKRRTNPEEVKGVMEDIKSLLMKIEEAVPFISLAVTTSGVNISASIPQNVSPSRLLQASGMLSAGDTAYCYDPFKPAQIGQTFWLSLYMLFSSHSHRQEQVSAKDLTWQEVMYKCRVNLQRVPLFYDEEEGETTGDMHFRAQNKIQEYCYELLLVEDLDDGRVHEKDYGPYEDVARSGLRTRIPVHQIAKMFYTTSGKLLGIEESNSPILLIKRDKNAQAPRKVLDKVRGYFYSDDEGSDTDERHGNDHHHSPTDHHEEEDGEDHLDLPKHLDPEWLAFEIYTDDPDDASSATISPVSSAESSRPGSPTPDRTPPPASLANALTNLTLTSSPTTATPRLNAIRSDLSILECLLRLTILQNFQQAQHTTVHDELLNLFLSDAVWGGSKEDRRVEREQARKKLGFDPFEATPGINRTIRPPGGTPRSTTGTPKRIDAHPITPRSDMERQRGRWVRWDTQTPREQWTPPERRPEWEGEEPSSPLGR